MYMHVGVRHPEGLTPHHTCREETVVDDKDSKATLHTFKLECEKEDGNRRIDAFLAEAYQYYTDLKRKKKEDKRWGEGAEAAASAAPLPSLLLCNASPCTLAACSAHL